MHPWRKGYDLLTIGSLVTTCFSSKIHHCIFLLRNHQIGSVPGHISDDALCNLLQVLLTCLRLVYSAGSYSAWDQGYSRSCEWCHIRQWDCEKPFSRFRGWICSPGNENLSASHCINWDTEWVHVVVISCYQTLLVCFRGHVVYWKPHLWLVKHTFSWSTQNKLEITSKG